MKTPVAISVALLLLAAVGSFASMHIKFASDHLDSLLGRIGQLKKEIEAIKTEKTALENEIQEATDLEAWVLASSPLQPLVVAIIRSMSPQSEIVDLTLERDAETPSQLRISMELNTVSEKQIADTLGVIRELNYREFNSTHTRVQGKLNYTARLLWKDPANRQTPEEREAQAGATP